MAPVIVCVDDDFRVRESLEGLLQSTGLESRAFASAEEMLQSGAVEQAACLVIDIRMPAMSGLELQRVVRLRRPELPIIVVSAHLDDEIRRLVREQGAVAIFDKPFNAADLVAAVGRALAH